jgi:hypothetical protein
MSTLTDAERTIIFNALTTAAHQYEKDAVTAYESTQLDQIRY